jgi:hypothetical protein
VNAAEEVAWLDKTPCKYEQKADARTRTGDPFITSFEPLSPPVTSSHLRSFPAPKLPDSRWLTVT